MIKPIITAEEAVQMVQSGDTLVIGGSGAGHAIPESLIEALGKRFRSTLQPRDLTVVHISGMGDQGELGLGHLADPRLIKRDIGGHWGMSPPMAQARHRKQNRGVQSPAGRIVMPDAEYRRRCAGLRDPCRLAYIRRPPNRGRQTQRTDDRGTGRSGHTAR